MKKYYDEGGSIQEFAEGELVMISTGFGCCWIAEIVTLYRWDYAYTANSILVFSNHITRMKVKRD